MVKMIKNVHITNKLHPNMHFHLNNDFLSLHFNASFRWGIFQHLQNNLTKQLKYVKLSYFILDSNQLNEMHVHRLLSHHYIDYLPNVFIYVNTVSSALWNKPLPEVVVFKIKTPDSILVVRNHNMIQFYDSILISVFNTDSPSNSFVKLTSE